MKLRESPVEMEIKISLIIIVQLKTITVHCLMQIVLFSLFFVINGSHVCKKSRDALSDPGSFHCWPRREEREVAIMDVLVDVVLDGGANLPHQQK